MTFEGYNDAQFEQIVAAFRQKSEFDRAKFQRQLNGAAWIYAEHAKLAPRLARPADRRSQLQHLTQSARALAKELTEALADPYIDRSLSDVVRAPRAVPDRFSATYLMHKTTDQRAWRRTGTLNLIDQLNALAEIATNAKPRPGGDGTRPTSARREFVLALRELYEDAALKPQVPTARGIDDGKVEFLTYLQAAVRPLGIKASDDALRKLYERAGTK